MQRRPPLSALSRKQPGSLHQAVQSGQVAFSSVTHIGLSDGVTAPPALLAGRGHRGRDVLRAVDHGGQLHAARLQHRLRGRQRGHLQPPRQQQLGRLPQKGSSSSFQFEICDYILLTLVWEFYHVPHLPQQIFHIRSRPSRLWQTGILKSSVQQLPKNDKL